MDIFGSDPGFVSRITSRPGFVNPVQCGPGFDNPIQSDPIRSDPGFVNAPSKRPHVVSTSDRSSDSTSTETESGDVDMREDLRSGNCSQDQSASSPNNRGKEQTIDMVAVRTSIKGPIMSSTSGRPCGTISSETKDGDVYVQENFCERSEDCIEEQSASIPKCQQTGSLQTNQGQDDQSVYKGFSQAPQTV